MQVKVFESQDMSSGLRKVRKELGPDALILSTRSVRNGRLGVLGKPTLEITAAIDDAKVLTEQTASVRQVAVQSFARQAYQYDSSRTSPGVSVGRTGRAADNGLDALKSAITAAKKHSHSIDHSNHLEMKDEIGELKTMVQTLASEINRLKAPQQLNTPGCTPSLPDLNRHPEDPISSLAQKYGILKETADTISQFARESLSIEELANSDAVITFLQKTIEGLLEIAPLEYNRNGEQNRIALIGPTGVGKTTTLAKIAARQISSHSRSIAFITIDTYRIAAVEQLKVYGEIMRLPVEVVISPSQLERALARHEDKDLVLIDTAGRSPRDRISLEDLAEFLKPEFNIKNSLVLSAVNREAELLDTIEQFSVLDIDNTVFTKIDESSSLGVLLNTQLQNRAPLSCLTNGQRVPEDFLEIDRETVSRLIIPPTEGSVS